MNRLFTALAMLMIVFAGCAVSPQTVKFKPLIDAPSYPIGRGRDLVIQVVDKRPVQQFGYRGGIYDTAQISPSNDVANMVRRALAERLSASDFVVKPPQAQAPLSMRVEIQAIEYTSSGSPLIDKVHVRCALRAITRNGANTLTTHYQIENLHRVLGFPSAAQNEAFLNEAMAQILRQLLQDKAVLNLLKR